MSNMKQYILGVIGIFLLLGCSKPVDQEFHQILNEHFLAFVDTAAYKTGSFFLIPNDTTKHKEVKNIIEVDTLIDNNTELGNALKPSLIKSNKTDFVELIEEPEVFTMNLSKLTNIGQFEIIPAKPASKSYEDGVVGKIRFSNFTLTQNKAILIVSKQSSPKSGVSNAYLFTKTESNWRIDTVIELERW